VIDTAYRGHLPIVSIVNTCSETIWIRMMFVDGEDCSPTGMWVELTGYDQFVFRVDACFGEAKGFLYVYVCQGKGLKEEVGKNCLIGCLWIWSCGGIGNPRVFGPRHYKALSVVSDGDLHLDGVEFALANKIVYFPCFWGQGPNLYGGPEIHSKVYFNSLTGGKFFRTKVDILVTNDNEQSWSTTHDFDCWDEVDLLDVSGATSMAWLQASNHDPSEPVGFPYMETGWIRITGDFAWNPDNMVTIYNASFDAVLLEETFLNGGPNFNGGPSYIGSLGVGGAMSPFKLDPDWNNGMFWSNSPNGK
jgi:hypothetical protein